MKKIVLIAIAFVGLQFGLNAQEVIKEPQTKEIQEYLLPDVQAQKDVDAMSSSLSLNEEQKAKAYTFSLAYEKKIIETRIKQQEQHESKRQDFVSAMAEYRSNIKSILTAEQLEKFNATYPEK